MDSVKIKVITIGIILSFFLIGFLKSQDKRIKVYVRGVAECTISLLPLSGQDAGKLLQQKEQIKNGDSTIFTIAKAQLPGEFLLRLNLKQNLNSTQYAVEKIILINDQDLALWINPLKFKSKFLNFPYNVETTP